MGKAYFSGYLLLLLTAALSGSVQAVDDCPNDGSVAEHMCRCCVDACPLSFSSEAICCLYACYDRASNEPSNQAWGLQTCLDREKDGSCILDGPASFASKCINGLCVTACHDHYEACRCGPYEERVAWDPNSGCSQCGDDLYSGDGLQCDTLIPGPALVPGSVQTSNKIKDGVEPGTLLLYWKSLPDQHPRAGLDDSNREEIQFSSISEYEIQMWSPPTTSTLWSPPEADFVMVKVPKVAISDIQSTTVSAPLSSPYFFRVRAWNTRGRPGQWNQVPSIAAFSLPVTDAPTTASSAPSPNPSNHPSNEPQTSPPTNESATDAPSQQADNEPQDSTEVGAGPVAAAGSEEGAPVGIIIAAGAIVLCISVACFCVKGGKKKGQGQKAGKAVNRVNASSPASPIKSAEQPPRLPAVSSPTPDSLPATIAVEVHDAVSNSPSSHTNSSEERRKVSWLPISNPALEPDSDPAVQSPSRAEIREELDSRPSEILALAASFLHQEPNEQRKWEALANR